MKYKFDLSDNRLRVRIIDIDAGKAIVLMHENDARRMSIHMGDRVVICKGPKSCSKAAIVDVTDTMVSEDELGVFDGVGVIER